MSSSGSTSSSGDKEENVLGVMLLVVGLGKELIVNLDCLSALPQS